MSHLIAGSEIKRIILVSLGTMFLLILLIFGMHIALNIGRYIGTLARYAVNGNICFF